MDYAPMRAKIKVLPPFGRKQHSILHTFTLHLANCILIFRIPFTAGKTVEIRAFGGTSALRGDPNSTKSGPEGT